MRIGMISPPWFTTPPRGYGGIEAVVSDLAEALQRSGHDVLLAAPAGSACRVERLPGFEAPVPGQLGSTVPEVRHVLRAHRALLEAGVDVVHDHTVAGPHIPYPASGIPIVTTVHGAFDPALTELYAALGRRVHTVAISRHQASTAGSVPLAAIIPHGIDSSAVPVGSGAGGYLCFLGRMSPSKGVREAAEVAREAGIPLRIAAKMREPAEHRYFDEAIRPILGPEIEFLGELRTAEKLDLVGDAIALLNPIAWDEPFGMVMIEALACGTPVIATPRGSAPEIVDHGVTGYLCGSRASLVAATLRATELSRAACRQVTQGRFSAERMASDYATLFADARAAVPLAAR
ncbi:MAG TPA: glycosyltransferase family 4 protein [Pseudolysinimonas sp.]|jgi:glycosyltransferase involved in cell wall biosynthesis|nr:glycosyltransferase family 4 protein [Pseudolysinimonas sp.]